MKLQKVNLYFSIFFFLFVQFSCSRPDMNKNSGQIVFQDNIPKEKSLTKIHSYPYIQQIKMENEEFSVDEIRQFFDERMLILSNGNLFIYDGAFFTKLVIDFSINNFELNSTLDTIFVVGENQGGYLTKSRFGTLIYHSFFNGNQGSDFEYIEQTEDSIYFISKTKILAAKKYTDSLKLTYSLPLGYEIKSAFVVANNLYLNVYPKGLVKLQNGELKEIDFKHGLKKDTLKYNCDVPESFPQVVVSQLLYPSLIFFADYRRMYTFSNKKQLKCFNLQDTFFSKDMGIQALAKIDSNFILLGTINSGVFLIDRLEHKILQHFTVDKGLLSNEIKSLFVDKLDNVWIGQKGGFVKINFSLSIKDYSYTGLFGKVTALSADDSLVGTSQALFLQNQDSNFEFNYKKINNRALNVLGIEKVKIGKYLIVSNSDILSYKNSVLSQDTHLPLINDYKYSKKNKKLYLATSRGIFIYELDSNKLIVSNRLITEAYYSVQQDERGNIWLGSDNHILLITLSENGLPLAYYKYKMPVKQKAIVHVFKIDNKVIFLQNRTVYTINIQRNILEKDTFVNLENKRFSIFGSELLTRTSLGIWQNENHKKLAIPAYLNLFKAISFLKIDSSSIILGTDRGGFYRINRNKTQKDKQECFISAIKSSDSIQVPLDNINLTAFGNGLEIYLTAPYFYGNKGVKFRYKISGLSKKWSKWQISNLIKINYLPYGVHEILYQAKNELDEYSFPKIIDLSVVKPFWLRTWFIISALLLLLGLTAYVVFILMRVREQQVTAEKKLLSEMVEERTNELQTKQTEILDSITYASRIQSAMLPNINLLKDENIDFFIFNRPKNIVSGDFYWYLHKTNQLFVTVGDCTGHGVPGAFMSVLGITLLNQILRQQALTKPELILEQLKASIIENLNQSDKQSELQDGIDMAFIKIDFLKRLLYFSGAYNPIYIVRSGKLIEFKGQRMPIGIFIRKDIFKSQSFSLQKDDIIYLFSDGYADQTGGEKGYKFSKKRLKALFTEIASKPMPQQRLIIETEIDAWKSDYPQVDDMMILGLKIK